MKQGDLVVRQSYGGDIIFRIQRLFYQTALLRGIDYRLMADASITDLQPVSASEVDEHEAVMRQRPVDPTIHSIETSSEGNFFEVPGKVLHLDGDPNYLSKSMELYSQLRVPAEGVYVREAGMSEALTRLLPQVNPDIVVITGHDGILKERINNDMKSLDNYKNSRHFVNAVRTVRGYERSRDSLVIIAGACQSHFEALLEAGANYASSPGRVLIHALDPLYIAAKVSFTPIHASVQLSEIIKHTMSGLEGLGGIETRGSYRIGMPKLKQL